MSTQQSRSIQAEERVLTWGEALHKDNSVILYPNLVNKPIDNAPAAFVPVATEAIQIIDLYTMGHITAASGGKRSGSIPTPGFVRGSKRGNYQN